MKLKRTGIKLHLSLLMGANFVPQDLSHSLDEMVLPRM